jgi:zinc transport system substrate-binding protein
LADVTSRKFIVFHPAWGYFAEQFDLVMIPIEVGGTEPSAAELSMVIDEAKEEDIRVIFAQPEFSTKSAETIASEIDGEVILISPLAYNWLENLQQVAQVMAEVLNQ